jgi:hypothetical protein
MKYPKYVYKRLNGQEYRCGVGDSVIENLKYEKETDLAKSIAKPVKKIS